MWMRARGIDVGLTGRLILLSTLNGGTLTFNTVYVPVRKKDVSLAVCLTSS